MSFSSALGIRRGHLFTRQSNRTGNPTSHKRRKALRSAVAVLPLESLESRTLLSSAPLTFVATDIAKPIPDALNNPIWSSLPLRSLTSNIIDVNVTVNITHPSDADLTLTLISPAGTRIPLARNVGLDGDNFINTVFDDQAAVSIAAGGVIAPFTGAFRPMSALAALNGEDPNGDWQLEVEDVAAGNNGGAPAILDGWSLTLTLAEAVPQIAGFVWNDIDRDGTRNVSLAAENNPDIIYVVDVGNNSLNRLSGATPSGDLNNDGWINTILDAQIEAYSRFTDDLITNGMGDIADVAIIAYSSTAVNVDVNPLAGAFYTATKPNADLNNNGILDLKETLASLVMGYGGVTGGDVSFQAPLQRAIDTFDEIQTPDHSGHMIFFAASRVTGFGGAFDAEVSILNAMGVSMRAFGAGSGADFYQLRMIDTAARVFVTTDGMFDAFTNGAGLASYTEPGVIDQRVYVDLNGSGAWDDFEPFTLTDADGKFLFSGLRPDTYTVRVAQEGDWQSSDPDPYLYSVSIDPGNPRPYDTAYFGQYQAGRVSGFVWNDANGNGYRDTNLVLGATPDIVIAIDISSAALDPFPRGAVGDVNFDGLANTNLDVQLAAAISLNQTLIAQGKADSSRISIVLFDDSARLLHFLPPVPETDFALRPSPEVVMALQSIVPPVRSQTVKPNYKAALQMASSTLGTIGTARGNANLLFFSPNATSIGGAVSDEVAALRTAGVNVHAFGVGLDASLSGLQQIDATAMVYTNGELLANAIIGKAEGTSVSYIETGKADVGLYIDANNNGLFDEGESFVVSGPDGSYTFGGLILQDYSLRTIVPFGWLLTAPAGGAGTVTLTNEQPQAKQNFGVVQTSSISGVVFNDRNGDGVRGASEPAIANATVYIDANGDGSLSEGEVSVVTDASGVYTITGLVPGDYIVRHVTPAGMGYSSPTEGVYYETVGGGQALANRNFADRQPAPDIALYGNALPIANGSKSPLSANRTNFGSAKVVGGKQINTFTIRNLGNAALLLTGRPLIRITGAQASDFTVIRQPSAKIGADGASQFRIAFDPRASGPRTAWVVISNNASGQSPYKFAIRGMGLPYKAPATARAVRAADVARSTPTSMKGQAVSGNAVLFASDRRITEEWGGLF